MDTPSQGTPQPTEQAPTSIQQIVEQPAKAAPTQAAPETTPAQPSLTAEQIADLQRRANEADTYKKQYESLLPDYTRKSQALAQLAGAQPQQPPTDPHAPIIADLVRRGYDEKEARDFVEVQQKLLAPFIQAQQQQYAALQSTNQIDTVMRQAWAKNPTVFTDPEIQQGVQEVLRQEALRGAQIDADYALDLAFVAAGRRQMAGKTSQPPPIPTGNMAPMFSMAQGYPARPAAAAPPQMSEFQKGVQAELEARYGKPKTA